MLCHDLHFPAVPVIALPLGQTARYVPSRDRPRCYSLALYSIRNSADFFIPSLLGQTTRLAPSRGRPRCLSTMFLSYRFGFMPCRASGSNDPVCSRWKQTALLVGALRCDAFPLPSEQYSSMICVRVKRPGLSSLRTGRVARRRLDLRHISVALSTMSCIWIKRPG